MPRPASGPRRRPSDPRARRQQRLRTLTLVLGALVVAALVLPMALTAAAAPTPTTTSDTDGTEGTDGTNDANGTNGTGAATEGAGNRVVLLGTAGLRWDDVGTLGTPALWEVSRHAGLGTVAARSVRSSACPADGWLAVSAGRRAADHPGEGWGECRLLEEPGGDGSVPGWADYAEAARASAFDPTLGLLGEHLADAGVPVAGIGPGAAIALADGDGRTTGTHVPLPSEPEDVGDAVVAALDEARLVVVDLGAVRDTGRSLVPRPARAADDAADDEDAGGTDSTDSSDGTDSTDSADGTDGTDDGATGTGGTGGTDGVQDADPGTEEDTVTEPAPGGESPAGPEVIAEPTRLEQVRPLDLTVGAVLDALGETTAEDVTVLLVSLADSGTRARMQLAAALGPSPDGTAYGETLLGTASTRQDAMMQTTDVTPTLVHLLGVTEGLPPGVLVGAPVRPVAAPASPLDRFVAVLDVDRHSAAVRPVTPPFVTWLIVLNLVLQLVVSIGLNGRVVAAAASARARWRGSRVPGGGWPRPTAALHGLRVAGVVVGALPVASFLANATPWWRAPSPSWALAGLISAWIAVITVAALLPRWRHPVLGPAGVVAGVTAAVLAVDIATGATLQVSAPMGVQPVVAGRFYGFNNTAFALFAAALVLTLATVTDPLVRAGRRRLAAAVIGVVGAAATVLIGMPGLGSDFGGPPAIVPGIAVLALLAAGVRLTWARFLAITAAGALAVTSFVVVDWLRPPEDRTHLGRFMETVLDGGVSNVVLRKLSQNLANLGGTWLTLLALGGIAMVAFVLLRPLRHAAQAPDGGPYGWLSSGEPLTSLPTAAPMLRPAVLSLAVTLGIGFLVNDSGIVIPAMGVAVAVPLLVTVSASWLLEVRAAAATAAGRTDPGAAAAELSRDAGADAPSGR